MVRLGVLTTVWKRPLISAFHFEWASRFQQKCQNVNVQLLPFYVLSENDPYLDDFRRLLGQHEHEYMITPSTPLSDKSQAGIEGLRDTYDIDWLMHLDSDEILSIKLMLLWRKQFVRNTLWFGSRSCYFVEARTGRSWEFRGYPSHPIKNGGSCVHREALERVDWKLWNRSLNSGLNNHEHKRLRKAGLQPVIIHTQSYYGVVEIKGGENAIHPMEWFQKKELIRKLTIEEKAELFAHHPTLSCVV